MLLSRKGARSRAEIPPKVLKALNEGRLETVNLVEWLAVDDVKLLRNVLAELKVGTTVADIIASGKEFRSLGVMKRIEFIAKGLFRMSKRDDRDIFDKLASHPSDTARSWACYMVKADETLTLKKRLLLVKPFATDSHFGVREIAWASARPVIADDIEKGIDALKSWATSRDANIRRFASEATRPRGVWCKHILELKENPSIGLAVIERLRSDSSKYVRDSVGNWLNDAGKTKPDWVLKLCKKWERESPTKETAYIVKRALRNLS